MQTIAMMFWHRDKRLQGSRALLRRRCRVRKRPRPGSGQGNSSKHGRSESTVSVCRKRECHASPSSPEALPARRRRHCRFLTNFSLLSDVNPSESEKRGKYSQFRHSNVFVFFRLFYKKGRRSAGNSNRSTSSDGNAYLSVRFSDLLLPLLRSPRQ